MGYFFISFLFVLFGNCWNYEYKEMYIKQKVDHFGSTNEDIFLQRYLVNMNYYDPGNATIFFYTGNEGDIEMFANNTGFMWEHAKEFKAGLVFAEHRYYGKSMPYGNDSYKDNEKRGYLSSEQALADFAYLIYYLRSHVKGGGKAAIIAFGGSYGGMLSAWFRMKYPHLVNGAIASSAPILMFQGLTSCGKFAEIVTQDFKNAGDSCAKSIRKSWDAIKTIGSTEEGAAFLTKTFSLCQSLPPSNSSIITEWLSDTWAFLAMTDYPYPTSFLNPLPADPIKVACKYLNDENVDTKSLVIRIAKAASVFHNYTGDVKCNDFKGGGGAKLGEEGWDYQACTEMVQPECQNGETDMYPPEPWNLTKYSEKCFDKWNVKPDPNKAYIMYGGANISASSNIVFTNGKLDPWYAGGVLKNLSDTLIAITIEDAAHHLDLRESNPADPQSVIDARKTMIAWMKKWVSQVRHS